jgi:hypothetical protein
VASRLRGIDLVHLDEDERRVILKALSERTGRLIEIVGDTTQASAARMLAARELIHGVGLAQIEEAAEHPSAAPPVFAGTTTKPARVPALVAEREGERRGEL